MSWSRYAEDRLAGACSFGCSPRRRRSVGERVEERAGSG